MISPLQAGSWFSLEALPVEGKELSTEWPIMIGQGRDKVRPCCVCIYTPRLPFLSRLII